MLEKTNENCTIYSNDNSNNCIQLWSFGGGLRYVIKTADIVAVIYIKSIQYPSQSKLKINRTIAFNN
jgi:hypothetical protein